MEAFKSSLHSTCKLGNLFLTIIYKTHLDIYNPKPRL